jgi:hypothetical protein
MLAGEIAFVVYAAVCVYCLAVHHLKAAPTSLLVLTVWGATAAALYLGVLR